jgi:hypothetical protein
MVTPASGSAQDLLTGTSDPTSAASRYKAGIAASASSRRRAIVDFRRLRRATHASTALA